MRLNWMYGALLATAIAAPSSAQISVYIGTPPPPIRYEEYGPTPGPGFVWVDGYWEPVGHHYRWVRVGGSVLHLKGLTGVIRTMTTTGRAGKCTRDTGTMRTTTTATGETTIMIATIVITTTITTDHDALMRVELASHSVLCIGGLDENLVGSAPYLCPAAPRTRS